MHDLYSGFKKVSEDEKQAVLQHENGHKLNIAKSGLNRKQRRQLQRLPLHQATGQLTEEELRNLQQYSEEQSGVTQTEGEQAKQAGRDIVAAVTKDVLSGVNETIAPASFVEQFAPQPKETSHPSMLQKPEMLQQTPTIPGQATIPLQAPEVQQPEVLAEPSAGLAEPSLEQPEKEQERPVASEAPQIDTTVPVQEPAVLIPDEEAMTDPRLNESDRANAFLRAAMKTQQKIMDAEKSFQYEMLRPENKINPDKYFDDMSTGRRIVAAISMLLGGFAQGLTGRDNPVLTMLDKEVERDIELQKLSLVQKDNLFKRNLDLLRDERAAYFQTASNLRSVVDMKLEEAKRSLDPNNILGKSAIDAAIAENRLKQQNAQGELAKMEMRKQYKKAAEQGQYVELPDELDERADRIVRILDDKGRPIKLYTRSPQIVKEAQDKATSINSAQMALKRIVEFNKQYGRQIELVGGVETEMASAAESLNQEALIAVQQLLSSGNISERNAELFRNIFPKAGAIKQGDAQRKAIQANKLINDMKTNLIQSYLTK